ncbi:helix-turn-helix domain-containing protein [Sphingomonas insulae]|uniref:helix-turn-helix domain-containing protein n=1 Tax=Sphingomonas insulae TaxID=424800 RepID=UPI002010EA53|nr:helix-turn-helix transcriptional regulator [Sphingomonas insulae]
MTDPNRFDRLTRRHRECLRGVRELKGSKEIADALGIEKSTVDKYLTEAVKVLGARNRREAALLLADHDAREQVADAAGPTEKAIDATPDKMGGDFTRLSVSPFPLPSAASPDEVIVGAPGVSGEAPSRPRSPGIRLPFRREGQRDNDQTVGDRLIWIQAITLGIAIAFGMLMTGLQVLTGLIENVAQRLP